MIRTRRGSAALVVVLVAAWGALTIITRDVWPSSDGLTVVVLVGFAATGLVVVRQQPRNIVGWLLVATAVLGLFDAVDRLYLVLDYRRHGGSLPLGVAAVAWRAGVGLTPFLIAFPAILLFPDGIVPSRRWARLLRAYVVLAVVFSALQFVGAGISAVGVRPDVNIRGAVGNVDVGSAAGLAWVLTPVFLVCWLAFVGRQVASWRRASGERRAQLKWLMCAAAICVGCAVLDVVAGNGSSLTSRVLADAAILGLATFPLAIGVGILRYRLYEIDRLISRTLSYAIVTGTLVAVFVGLVALITGVLPFSSPLAVAASTLVVAALFNPVRRRAQRLVDRRFNRARYDAEATVDAFARRLRDAIDLESVQEGLRDAVSRAVEPSHLSLWIRSSRS